MSIDPDSAESIFERCAALEPALRSPETRILSHNAGLRPARMGGMRLELEVLTPDDDAMSPRLDGIPDEFAVCHAYGIGPAGS